MGAITRHVPILRRFARALAGSRQFGDTLVGEALRALIDGKASVEAGSDPRTVLFRAFFLVWQSAAEHLAQASREAHVVDRRLQAMMPIDRLVFLLVTMEGFDEADVAAITGFDLRTVRRLVAEANASLARQMKARVLIIEDEWLIAGDLKRLVESMGHGVVGMATRRDTAIAQASILKPDLILSDVQLDDCRDGLEAVETILKTFDVPVVFVTGHSDRLLTGTGSEPTYVVGKPFYDDVLRAVIAQAVFFRTTGPVAVD